MTPSAPCSASESLELLESIGFVARTDIPSSRTVQFTAPGTPRVALYYPADDTWRTFEHQGRVFDGSGPMILYLVTGIVPVGARP